jgi:hypothetical protein
MARVLKAMQTWEQRSVLTEHVKMPRVVPAPGGRVYAKQTKQLQKGARKPAGSAKLSQWRKKAATKTTQVQQSQPSPGAKAQLSNLKQMWEVVTTSTSDYTGFEVVKVQNTKGLAHADLGATLSTHGAKRNRGKGKKEKLGAQMAQNLKSLAEKAAKAQEQLQAKSAQKAESVKKQAAKLQRELQAKSAEKAESVGKKAAAKKSQVQQSQPSPGEGGCFSVDAIHTQGGPVLNQCSNCLVSSGSDSYGCMQCSAEEYPFYKSLTSNHVACISIRELQDPRAMQTQCRPQTSLQQLAAGPGYKLPMDCFTLKVTTAMIMQGNADSYDLWTIGCTQWKHVACATVIEPDSSRYPVGRLARKCASVKKVSWSFADTCRRRVEGFYLEGAKAGPELKAQGVKSINAKHCDGEVSFFASTGYRLEFSRHLATRVAGSEVRKIKDRDGKSLLLPGNYLKNCPHTLTDFLGRKQPTKKMTKHEEGINKEAIVKKKTTERNHKIHRSTNPTPCSMACLPGMPESAPVGQRNGAECIPPVQVITTRTKLPKELKDVDGTYGLCDVHAANL